MAITGITVVVPVFNKMPDLRRSVESLAAQTVPPDAILFVDDGSTDGGREYLEALGWPNARLIRRDRPGPGGYAARNEGIRQAETPWIAFLDADDQWAPGYLDAVTALAAAAGREVGCLFTGFDNVAPDGGRFLLRYFRRNAEAGVHRMDFAGLLENWLADGDCPIWTSAVTIRRDVLLETGMFPEDRCRRGGDKDTWLRVMRHTAALCDPRPHAIYRRDSVNMVTERGVTTFSHCIRPTVEGLIEGAPAGEVRLLKRLWNLEAYLYARRAAARGQFSSAALDGFYADVDPLRYLALRLFRLSLVRRGMTLARGLTG